MGLLTRMEKVFYLRREKDYSYEPELCELHPRFAFFNRPIPVPAKEHFYMPKRKMELIKTESIRKYLKGMEEIVTGSKPMPIISIIRNQNTIASMVLNDWEMYYLPTVPVDATLIKIEKRKIDKVFRSYKLARSQGRSKKYSEPFKFNPSQAEIDFFSICEEVFCKNQ
jgi:hypothetical protein